MSLLMTMLIWSEAFSIYFWMKTITKPSSQTHTCAHTNAEECILLHEATNSAAFNEGHTNADCITHIHSCHHLSKRWVALSSEGIERKEEQMNIWIIGAPTISITLGGRLASRKKLSFRRNMRATERKKLWGI